MTPTELFLQKQFKEARANSNGSTRYPSTLIRDAIAFIESTSEQRNMASWARLFGLSGSTLGLWRKQYHRTSPELDLKKDSRIDLEPAFIQIKPSTLDAAREVSTNQVTLQLGQGQAQLTLNQLAFLLHSSEIEELIC